MSLQVALGRVGARAALVGAVEQAAGGQGLVNLFMLQQVGLLAETLVTVTALQICTSIGGRGRDGALRREITSILLAPRAHLLCVNSRVEYKKLFSFVMGRSWGSPVRKKLKNEYLNYAFWSTVTVHIRNLLVHDRHIKLSVKIIN